MSSNRNATSDDIKPALLGGRGNGYPAEIATVALILSSIYYIVPAILFVILAPKHPHLAQRNVFLTLSLVFASQLLLCFGAYSRLSPDFDCTLFIWVSSLAWPTALSSILFRSLRLVFLTRIHEYKSGSIVRGKVDNLVHEELENSSNSIYSAENHNRRRFSFETGNINAAEFTDSNSRARESVELRSIRQHSGTLEKQQLDASSSVVDVEAGKLPWWLKHRYYLTDYYLSVYQLIVLFVSILYCSLLSIFDPDMSVTRNAASRSVGTCYLTSLRVVILPYGWIILFTFVASPIILISTRKIQDNYKIKRDLLASTVIATLLFPILLIWNFALPRYFSSIVNGGVLFGWIGLMLAFASRDFTTENILFILAYKALAEHVSSKLSNNQAMNEHEVNIDTPTFDVFNSSFRLPATSIPSHMFSSYRAIYDTFFRPGADLELNLPSKMLSKVRHTIVMESVVVDQTSGTWIKKRVLPQVHVNRGESFIKKGLQRSMSGATAMSISITGYAGNESRSSLTSFGAGGNRMSRLISGSQDDNGSGSEKEYERFHTRSVESQNRISPEIPHSSSLTINEDELLQPRPSTPFKPDSIQMAIRKTSGRASSKRKFQRIKSILNSEPFQKFEGVPANIYDDAFQEVLNMLYTNTYSKWVRSKRGEF
ncbi:hypothetical protein HK098_004195 [Nowakowskiella sp. JEL0407]|nr:hypothetical protein HK098_004195 [Nowakowskiella sp. JEL0407]